MGDELLDASIEGSRLLAGLSAAERARIEPHLELVDVTQGDTLLVAGEPIPYVWFPHNCVTSTLVDTPQGGTIEVGIMGLEGVVGLSLLLGLRASNTTVMVQISGRASRMQATDFVRTIREPRGQAYETMLRYCDAFLAMVAQTAACNALHPIEARLARWILMTHDRVQREEIPLTQEYLAYMLGVRRASVSIAASAMQQQGLIKYSRGSLRVVDRGRLEYHSCACYGIVRSITERLYAGLAA